MISLKVSTKNVLESTTQSYAFFVEEKFTFSKQLKEIAKNFFPHLEQLFKERQFTGSQSSSLVVPVSHDKEIIYLIFVGLGSAHKKVYDIEYYRRAVGKIIRSLEACKITSVAFELPSVDMWDVTTEYLAQQTATIALMTGYHFDDFKKDRLTEKKFEVTVCISASQKKAVEKGIEQGEIIARAVNATRHWIDTPPSRMTP